MLFVHRSFCGQVLVLLGFTSLIIFIKQEAFNLITVNCYAGAECKLIKN